MEEILKEVLIKKCGNRLHDQVLVIENLPSRFLWEQTRKMTQQYDREGYPTGNLVPDKSGELIWTLRIGIERSQTGDGGFCFWTTERDSNERLLDIMQYVEGNFPRDQRIPAFVDNAQVRGEMNTGPISIGLIPRIQLTAPILNISPAPVLAATSIAAAPSGILPKKRGRKPMTDEQRQEMLKRLEKARNARMVKAAA